MTAICEANLSAGLLYGALPKLRRSEPMGGHEPDVAGEASGYRPWIEGDLAVWQPDATLGTIDVLVRAVDRPAGIAEVLVLTPHIAETGEDLVAPLEELDVKGRRDIPSRADFQVGDRVDWPGAGSDAVFTIAEPPHADADWVRVAVEEGQVTRSYATHRGSIRPLVDQD